MFMQNITNSFNAISLLMCQRGRSNEHKLNESYMKQKIGTPICFGDIIQV